MRKPPPYDHIEAQPLPEWMSADPSCSIPKYPTTPEDRQLQETVFTSLLELVLDEVIEGRSAKTFVERDPRGIKFGRFMSWVMRNDERKQRYEEAQEIGSAVVVEEMKDIADGSDAASNGMPEDIQRSTLRVNVRKWIAQVHNRKRYGDIKQLDVTTTNNVNLRVLLDKREEKLRLIEGTVIEHES